MKKFLGVAVLLTMLPGCMTYGYFGHEKVYGGYKDSLIQKGKYDLEYHGGSAQSYEKLESFFHIRARELCNRGYQVEGMSHQEYEETFEYSFIVGPTKFRVVKGIVVCADDQA